MNKEERISANNVMYYDFDVIILLHIFQLNNIKNYIAVYVTITIQDTTYINKHIANRKNT